MFGLKDSNKAGTEILDKLAEFVTSSAKNLVSFLIRILALRSKSV